MQFSQLYARIRSLKAFMTMIFWFLFSKATMFDLILPRLLTGERLGKRELAAYGDGGLLSRDALWRFPPYRPKAQRGELSE